MSLLDLYRELDGVALDSFIKGCIRENLPDHPDRERLVKLLFAKMIMRAGEIQEQIDSKLLANAN